MSWSHSRGRSVWIKYRDQDGVVAWKHIAPLSGSMRMYPPSDGGSDPEWKIQAREIDTGKWSYFNMKDILAWSVTSPPGDVGVTVKEPS